MIWINGKRKDNWRFETVSILNWEYEAPVTDISRALVYTPPAQYWSLHHTSTAPTPSFPAVSVYPHPLHFIHTQKGERIDCTQETKHSHRIMNQWVFVVLDCEPRSETSKDFSCLVEKDDAPPRQDDFTNLLHPTLQTKSSFFVLKVENIMIELTYIYTHTHTPYMLNTVNILPLLLFDYRWFFVTGDCASIILCSSFETLFSTNVDDFKCSRVTEQNKNPSKEEKRSPEAVLEDEKRKVDGLYFCLPAGFLLRCHSMKLFRSDPPWNTNTIAFYVQLVKQTLCHFIR